MNSPPVISTTEPEARKAGVIVGSVAELVEKLKKDMLAWHDSVKSSYEGSEYGTKSLDRLGKSWSSPLSAKAKKSKNKKQKSGSVKSFMKSMKED